MVQINAMPIIQFVQWPAIIKLYADDELIYIANTEQFTNDDALRQMHVQANDMLIDSQGAVYRIQNRPKLELYATGASLSLHEVEDLLRRHLAKHGTCCVSKFHASSIDEALTSTFG